MRSILALLLLAPLASADVRIVSPAGPYTTIQAAIDAANDGDLVLVKPGPTYTGFHVQAKSLTVAADNWSSSTTLHATVIVSDLEAGQTVSLIGLRANLGDLPAAGGIPQDGLFSTNNQGSVRCQNCTFYASWTEDWAHPNGGDGVRIENSADVSLVGCSLAGGYSYWEEIGTTIQLGGRGASCLSSTLTLFDCTLWGGWGAESMWGISGNGGPALKASGSTVFSANSTMEGGYGGGYGSDLCPCPGVGGPGVDLSTGSLMHTLSCDLAGGADGDYWNPGPDAPAYVGGTYDFMVGASRTLALTKNPMRELQSVNLSFHGTAGEQVYLLVGLETAVQWDPLHLANFLIAPPQYRTLYMGTTNASGDLSRSVPFGDLGAGVQSQTYFLQPLFSGAGGAQQLGSPVTLAVLDSAF